MVLLGFMAQYFLAKATFLCSPALIMPFSYISVIIGFVIDILLFDAQYTWLMMIGMIMACIGLFSKFVALYLVKNTNN
jgi:drug/metabolite transporter (DMT)-like permease